MDDQPDGIWRKRPRQAGACSPWLPRSGLKEAAGCARSETVSRKGSILFATGDHEISRGHYDLGHTTGMMATLRTAALNVLGLVDLQPNGAGMWAALLAMARREPTANRCQGLTINFDQQQLGAAP